MTGTKGGRGIVHPFTKALYEQDGNGQILVTSSTASGTFTIEGRWVSGDLLECDPHLCGWVGGPKIGHHRLTTK